MKCLSSNLHSTATKATSSSYIYLLYLLIPFNMSPSILKPTWPLKKFSFSKTPALIKRDIACLFSSKARAEKRAEEERQRARLEMKPCAQVVAPITTITQEQVPQTPVRSPTAPIKVIEPHSASKDTATTFPTFDSGSSPITPPSTAATSLVSFTNLPTTYGAAVAYFEHCQSAACSAASSSYYTSHSSSASKRPPTLR
ncbi:hypothetical protein P171DRAFT_503146 [Karstenula rhodostoma CBS 690.94]|uniref:Uncharacterized protein n=1 Tax=Karstenula rhodostoma CBS 690.94 TaxID=1392251 RepID=A0A9P4PUP8_9PLEO|nr:hypothetical protein P171DRAFT_503146 [Karstenula rhodostoma CBS 690.94]